jgi:iron complex transport system substrate-binding protein
MVTTHARGRVARHPSAAAAADGEPRLIEYGLVPPSAPFAAIAAVVVLLAVTGCGEREEPTGSLSVDYPVTVGGAGAEPLEVAGPPSRIVALDPDSAEIVDALGAGSALVGAPASATVKDGQPVNVSPEAGQIDVEAVVSLEPDLVIATLETDPVDVAQVRRRTGAPLYVQPSATVDDVVRAVLELGFVLGRPAEARALAGQITADVAEVEDRLADSRPVTVFVDTGLFVAIPERSIFADLLRRAKGTNVAPSPALGPISAAELAARDPDYYLATSDSGVTLESLQRNPDTQNLAAVREGRFAVLPVELVAEPGPELAEALQTIAVAIHPDAFR